MKRLALSAFFDKVLHCIAGLDVSFIWIWLRAVRKPWFVVMRRLTIILSGLREFQQMLDFYSLIDVQPPCACARAMEAG